MVNPFDPVAPVDPIKHDDVVIVEASTETSRTVSGVGVVDVDTGRDGRSGIEFRVDDGNDGTGLRVAVDSVLFVINGFDLLDDSDRCVHGRLRR